MGRSKIKIELIQDYKKKTSTLVKRKANLVKKISELSILCDIKACMIVYEGNNHQVISPLDQIWPNDPTEVQELINLYKNQPLEGRTKKAKTLSNFFENNQKKKSKIKVEKYSTWDSRFDYLSEKELQNLAGVLEKRIENAKEKVEFLKSMNVQDSNIGSLSRSNQEIWDYSELMNNNNLMNQTTPWPISYVNPFTDHNNFFQANIPISGVNSMGAGMDNGLLTINDYQFSNADYSTMIETENWLANNGISSSSTMQPMTNNEDSSTTMEYPFIYNGYTHMPYGFQ